MRLLIAFPLLYCAMFAAFPTKLYHYPAIIPALCMASGVVLDQMLARTFQSPLFRTSLIILGITVLGIHPVLRSWPRVERALFIEDYSQVASVLSARRWIEENIPPGSGIFYFGWYPYGPRILHQNANKQARMGEYFMYGRGRNSFLRKRFAEAYSEVVRSGRPTYNIHYRRMKPYQRGVVRGGLASYCRKHRLGHIILAGSGVPHSELSLRWRNEVIEVAHFFDKRTKNEISVFEVPLGR